MGPLYRIPRQHFPTYEEGKLAARKERETNPDERTKRLEAAAQARAERNKAIKAERTTLLARESTARRADTRSARCPQDGSLPSPAMPPFDATLAARWQRSKGEPALPWWAETADREAHAIELLAAAGRLRRRRVAT